MNTDISGSWKTIEKWYASNVSVDGLILPGPASDEEIHRLESLLGFSIPDDLKASYLRHNGTSGVGIFPFGYYLFALTEIAKEWTFWCDAVHRGAFSTLDANPNDAVKPMWWNAKWIPITGNGGGDHDCVDMDPLIGGVPGQIIEFSHETGPRRVAASSFGDWIEAFAQNLAAGQYSFDEDSSTLLPANSDK